MGRKRKNKRNGSDRKTQSASPDKLSTKEFIIFGAFVILAAVLGNSFHSIINYPQFIWKIVGGGCIGACFIYFAISFIRHFKEDRSVGAALRQIFGYIIQTIAFTVVVGGLLLVPFNYYDIHMSRKNPAETEVCEIASVSSHDDVYYLFKGKECKVSGSGQLINEMYVKRKDFQKYNLVITIRQGLFGSYVLDGWDIREK